MNTKYNFYSTLGAALLLLSLTASAESKPIASAEKKEKKEKAEKKEKTEKEKKETAGKLKISKKEVKRDGDDVNVKMDFKLDDIILGSNRGLIYTPMIVNDEDTLKLPAVEVMGRKRYIYYQRNNATASKNPLIVEQRQNKKKQTLHYIYTTPFQDWMSNSQLVIGNDTCGCNQVILAEGLLPAGDILSTPQKLFYAYQQPKAEAVKIRQENGSARLNFKVNKWDIVVNLGNNAKELAKMIETLELVKNDSDVTITQITLHGYASPDGGYANNDKLSRNRTQALKDYLTSVYPIDQKLIKVAATAEDWEGTAEYIAHNNIPQKDIALGIINSSLQPDAKEKALKRKAPEAHRFLLQNVWPGLRRTDYTIEYDVKAFNLEEAKKVIKTRPQKLSLQEMYMVANSLPKGSDEYNNVFETAVKLFPEDKLANLNAAYIAIERGDKVSAEKYLKKVGDTPEANNARGCLAVQKEDYQAAKEYFEKAVKGGLKKAQENLDKVNKVLE